MTGFEKYLINQDRYQREREIVWSKDKDNHFTGDVRDDYLTKLFTADRWGHTREGLKKFMATDWTTKLGDTFDALHEHYYKPTGGEEYHLDMPKDYDELERVARLFRETYMAYFVWHCMNDVAEGYETTAWHYMATALQYCDFRIENYPELLKLLAAEKDEGVDDDVCYQLWLTFFDRVYGRSRKFNINNYVAANSVLCMLESRYWEKFERAKRDADFHNDLQKDVKREEAEYNKTAQEVEDIINGKDSSR